MSTSTKHGSARQVQVVGQVRAVSVGARVPGSYRLAWGGSPCSARRVGRHEGRDVVAKGASGRLG